MIYFKVDIGYLLNSTGAQSPITIDFSNVVWTDYDRYWGVGTIYKTPFTIATRTQAQFQNAADASFGVDFERMMFVPDYLANGYRNAVINNGWIPWAYYNIPNLAAISQQPAPATGYCNSVIYFKNLNKLVVGSYGNVYSVSGTTATRMTSDARAWFSGQSAYFPFIENYTPGMNLAMATYHVLYAAVNSTGTRSSGVTTNYSTNLQILFGDNPTPDIIKGEGEDPYEEGAGSSGPGGGDGTFDFESTDVQIPSLPSIGAVDCGFTASYKPTSAELKSLANYMWANTATLENLKGLVANPIDVILGLHIIPSSNGHPASTSSTLVVGNISTGLVMPKLTEQYFEVDCGTVQVQKKWGAYLDYSPYSKLSLYLPYIGFVALDPDDCMGGSIRVVYHVDALSGACVAFVYCVSNRGADGHVLYTFNGSCSTPCPITSGQYASVFDFISNAAEGAMSLAMGSPSMLRDVQNAIVDSVKPQVTRSGDFSGSCGLMGLQYPFLVLTVPRMCIPGSQNVYKGYPSFVTLEMSTLKGYAEIDVTHLNGMTCTAAESEEIISLLESGVIF